MPVLHDLVQRIGSWEGLDGAGQAVDRVVRPALGRQPLKDLLNGAWLGHPLHPLLIVAPLGAWISAGVLDLAGEDVAPAADRLVELGIATTLPTAAAGVVQWMDTGGEARRVGLAHAAANVLATGLQIASALARRRGRRGLARALSLGGLAAVGAGGYLGGHLSYALGVGVDHTAFQEGPDDWTDTGVGPGDLAGGRLAHAHPAGRHVLLAEVDGRIAAFDGSCPHAGAPLAEGERRGDCVVCPWHGSVFSLATGEVEESPATTPLSHYDTRVVDGKVQVRAVPVTAGRPTRWSAQASSARA